MTFLQAPVTATRHSSKAFLLLTALMVECCRWFFATLKDRRYTLLEVSKSELAKLHKHIFHFRGVGEAFEEEIEAFKKVDQVSILE